MSHIISIQPLGFPWETKDPFLFCAHHRDLYPKGKHNLAPDASLEGRRIGEDFTIKDGWRMYHGQTIPGFPCHPHRGFETVTIAKEGVIDHADSLGASGRFGTGDVQWMTAGSGVQHSEMFPMLHTDKENTLEIFQVWLNLPRVSKMVDPHFKMLWNKDIPLITETDGDGNTTKITVVAGKYKETKPPQPTPDSWANDPNNNVAIWTIKMEEYAEWVIPFTSESTNRSLYFYKGESCLVEEQEVKYYHKMELHTNADVVIKNGSKEGFFLLLQGNPINEPVARYGPFVMNTEEEIQQTVRDYQKTQFGGWPWSRPDQVHDKNKSRFALHANGLEEFGGTIK